ncbi:MAG: LamG domain-containing protein [Planctomycetes bacterium]|nr:LamG domain-containing protein [Planctomycetota bacterium]
MTSIVRRCVIGAVLAGTMFWGVPTRAAVTSLNLYDLGDQDPGAAAGLDGSVSTIDSVAGQNLNREGLPTYVGSPPATGSDLAIDFNGIDQRYRLGSTVSSLTDNFGIEAWVQTDSTGANASIAYNGNTSNAGWGLFRLGANYGALYGGKVAFGSTPAGAGNWTHVALVRQNGVSTFYSHGVPSGSTTGTAPNAPAGNFAVGGNPATAAEVFDGRIDQVRVFSFAPGQFNPLEDLSLDATLAQFRLGESDAGAAPGGAGAAVTVNEISGPNLTKNGAPTYGSYLSAAGPELTMDFSGAADEFYGHSNVLSVANDNFILQARAKPTATGGNAVLAHNGSTSTSGYGLLRQGDQWRGLFGGKAIFGGATVQLDRWNDLAIVREAGTSTLYVNGVAAGSTGTAPNVPSGLFMVGANAANGAEGFAGQLDDVQLSTFSGAFDPAMLLPPSFEVLAHYRLGENDPGAAAGSPGNPVTVDDAGNLNLNKAGTPSYQNSPASSLAMGFTGTAGENYSSAPVVTPENNNWVLEAWVNTQSDAGVDILAYNGNTSTSGFGLIRNGNEWQGLFGGIAVLDFDAPVTLDEWTNLALVRENGSTQLYVDGTQVGPTFGQTPNVPAGWMMIGGNPNNAGETLLGGMDEVRLSLFAGRFDPETMLLINAPAAVPEPSSILLALLGLLGLTVIGGRSRKGRD